MTNAAVIDNDTWNFYQMLLSWTRQLKFLSNAVVHGQRHLIKISIVVVMDSGN